MIERQEIYCHSCDRYVQFDMDTEAEGCYVLSCPVCKHKHYRCVKDGKITDDRWGSANAIPISTSTVTYSYTSSYTSCSSTDYFAYVAWTNYGTGG